MGKGVRVKAKNVSGEGFSVRFTKRPFLGKKAATDKKPETTKQQDAKVSESEPTFVPGIAETQLWVAARMGDCATIRVLVVEGVDLEARDMDGRTALNIATQYNQKEAQKTLLAAREMRRMAAMGDLPKSGFFRKFHQKSA